MVHDLQVGGVQYANISGHLVATTDLDNVARYLPTKWQTKKKNATGTENPSLASEPCKTAAAATLMATHV
jgi:hypothetical protein